MDKARLKKLIEKYFLDNPDHDGEGRVSDAREFKGINKKVAKLIPDWYKEILTTYPLAGLEIGIPNDFGQDEYIGKPKEELPLMGITFLSVKEIEECALKYFPDYELIDLKHLRIAEDKYSTQEGVYINTTEDDPSIRLVFHDFGDTGKEVLKESELLLDKYSDIFVYGKKRERETE